MPKMPKMSQISTKMEDSARYDTKQYMGALRSVRNRWCSLLLGILTIVSGFRHFDDRFADCSPKLHMQFRLALARLLIYLICTAYVWLCTASFEEYDSNALLRICSQHGFIQVTSINQCIVPMLQVGWPCFGFSKRWQPTFKWINSIPAVCMLYFAPSAYRAALFWVA